MRTEYDPEEVDFVGRTGMEGTLQRFQPSVQVARRGRITVES